MRTKFDVGDFILLKEGRLEKIEIIHIDSKEIRYSKSGFGSLVNESQITHEYLDELEKYLKTAQETLEIMKFKIGK